MSFDDSKLIFIISQPRSGSTLLQSILSNNSLVATASEPWILLPFLSLYKPGLITARYDYDIMTSAVNEFVHLNAGEEEFKAKLKNFILSIYSWLDAPGTKHILDKTPRYYEIGQQIVDMFPQAKILVLKRNPFAVLNSVITSWNIDTFEKLIYYKRDLINAPQLINKFLSDHRDNKNVREVFYEDLVAHPVKSFQGIYHWLGMEFKEGYLQYGGNSKLKGNLGDQVSVKSSTMPVAENLDAWKGLIKIPFWNNFFRGYSCYLGDNFLSEYGKYEAWNSKKTDEFKYFMLLAKLNNRKALNVKQEVVHLAKLFYYYLKFGNYKSSRGIVKEGFDRK